MKILLISHWFPPVNIIGAARPYNIARHLADRGHTVLVIHAAQTNFSSAQAVDMSGIKTLAVQVGAIGLFLEPSSRSSKFIRLVKGVLRQLIYPDYFATMRSGYIGAAREALKVGFMPDLVISSALPFSSHLVARSISRQCGCKWIADNRDLWAESPYRKRLAIMREIDRRFEKKILSEADLITVVGTRMADKLKMNVADPTKVVVIRNGADSGSEYCPVVRERASGDAVRVLYSGILYDGVRDPSPLFRAMGKMEFACAVDFYGSETDIVSKYKRNFPDVVINDNKAVPKIEIKKMQRASDFLLVILGTDDFEKSVLTGKFFEYVEARRPIIAICDDDSDLGRLVKRFSLGVASRDPDEIAEYIRRVVRNGLDDLPAPSEELTREFQLRVLERHLHELTNEE